MRILQRKFIVITILFVIIISAFILILQRSVHKRTRGQPSDFQNNKTLPIKSETTHQITSSSSLVSDVQTDIAINKISEPAKFTSPATTREETNNASVLPEKIITEAEQPSEIINFAKQIIEQLKDTSIPLEKREKIITELAIKGDKASVSALKSAVTADIYLSLNAMSAIGGVTNELLKAELAEFVRGFFNHEDSRMVCSALRSYAKLKGRDAIPEIIEVIRQNKNRPDGHSDMIAYSGVKLLGELYATESIPFLREELSNAIRPNWNLEYGSHIMHALKLIGTPEARKVAGEYAQTLSSRIPSDPLAREYFKRKIEEAQTIADVH
jgi:hypothetical protein